MLYYPWLRLSSYRLRTGCGPTLCIPIATTHNDGPYRTKKFELPKIPNNFNHHLPTADVSYLVRQAEQFLFHPEASSDETWIDFIRRCGESSHLFQPVDCAVILRTIDERKADPKNLLISKIGDSQLHTHRHLRIPGPALVTFFNVYSKRMPTTQAILTMLKEKIPESINELSALDVLEILKALKNAQLKETKVCQRVYRKIIARIPEMKYRGNFQYTRVLLS